MVAYEHMTLLGLSRFRHYPVGSSCMPGGRRRALASIALLAWALPAAAAPVFLSTPPLTAQVGSPYTYQMSALETSIDGTTELVYSAPTLPGWLTFDGVDTISGTPAAGDVGPSDVVLQATDGTATATQSFTIAVAEAPNSPPVLDSPISPDPQTATEGKDYSFDVSGFFSDPDGDKLSFAASGLPGGLNIDAHGHISGRPADGTAAASPYAVTVTASDGMAQASGSYTLNVRAANEPPTLPDPPPRLSTPEDVPLAITATLLGARDEDPSSLTVLLSAPGPDAHFTLTGDGTTVQPEKDYDGTLEVGARVKDSGGLTSNAVTVTIDVTPVNDPPRIAAIPDQSATEDAPFSLDLSTFVSDPEGDTLTYRAAGLPAGLLLDPLSGLLSGTPPVGTRTGDYDVQLSVNDGSATGQGDFRLTVIAAGHADLEAGIDVSPNPVLVAKTATWTVKVANRGAANVANLDLEVAFTGDTPFRLDTPDASCTPATTDSGTNLSCRLGPLAGGDSTTLEVTGAAARAGQVAAVETVSIADAVPIDDDQTNDTARATLDVTESLSDAPAETLDAPGARALATGDFDGDGLADLAAATGAAKTVLVFLNGADPNNSHKLAFSSAPISVDAGSSADGVAAADLDGDGATDLVLASPDGPDRLLMNTGAASFASVELPGGNAASAAVAVADLNGDGLPDLAFANSGANTIYINGGAGAYTRSELRGAGNSVAVVAADFTGDALPDLVFANADGSATLYVNTGGAAFGDPVPIDTGPTTSVAADDFDGDGALDLVFGQTAGASPANRVYVNTTAGGSPSFFAAAELGGAGTVDVLADDFDLDGLEDVITINAAGGHELYTNGGAANTTFLLHPEQFSSSGALGAVAGKFNGDDRLDVAVAGGDAVEVFFNDGQGNFGLGDQDAPTLTLNGDAQVTVTVGADYVDAGATAMDTTDGDLTDEITVDDPVDTSVIGDYTITYNVVDSSGNAAATLERTVEVKARDATGGGGGGGGVSLDVGLLALAALLAALRRRTTAVPPSQRPEGPEARLDCGSIRTRQPFGERR